MAAESAVTFLFNQLSLLLQQERGLLGGIGNDAEFIRDELGEMRAFLRAADEKEESNPQFKEWVKKVREITYDTEDLLEIYMLRVALPRPESNGFNQYIKRMYASVKNLRVRHQVASEFQNIKLRVENVSKNGQKYKDMYDFKVEGSSNLTYDTRGDALLLEETEVLGIEKPKKQLVDWLMQSDDHGLKVISVVGMGGLGKTTLVKKIYDDILVKANFDRHVWVAVSESFKLEHLLRNIINHLATEAKLQPPQNLEAMTSNDMKEYVYSFLKDRTYLIVLDDIWKMDAWESIRYAFPRKGARYRVIITTRSYNVGNAACCETNGHLYHLDPLNDEKSEELFYKKAFPGNSCPAYLNEISKNILRRCHGLPLAIVVIGGLLATKHNNLEDWKMFERTIGLELQGDSLKTMNKLLSLSYYDLPYYLKACFLYLSIFPEDELLSKWEVIRLWIAEGFVVEIDGMTREEVAETYLNELLNRSLMQVADTYLDGRPRKFCIHDILREYIISKSREHNLLAVACGEEMNGHDKIRRMVIDAAYTETKESYINVKNLRSLFWLGYAHSNTGLIFQKVLEGRCRVLKVLNIRGAPLIDSIPHEVFKLYCLKYLCLRRTNIKVIPKAIGNLENLETLDLKQSKVTELPIEILKLHKLRNLLVYSYEIGYIGVQSFKAPFEIGSHLTSLQKLRRLGIYSIEEDELMDLDHSVPPSTLSVLRGLSLRGRLEKLPQWTHFLDGLTELCLSWSRLKEDPLQHLGVLPNLVVLGMVHFPYEGEELIFQGGQFQKLKKLVLGQLRALRYVRVEMNSMPRLEELTFRDCEVMEEFPEGIQHLTNLQLVEFVNMPEKFNERVVEQKSKLAHISKVEIWDVVDDEWRQRQM